MRLAVASLLLLLVVGCAKPVHVREIFPGDARGERSPERVEVFKNAPPARPFVARYVIDAHEPTTRPEGDIMIAYRDAAATLGCDAVVVYTADHPIFESAASPSDVLLVKRDGTLAWQRIDGEHADAKGFVVELPNGKYHALSATSSTAGLCLFFES